MNTLLRFHAGISIALSLLALTFLVIYGEKMVPGGPFVSFRGDITPHIFALAALFFAFVRFRSYSTGRRVSSILIAGFAVLISTLTAHSTYAFFHEPFARGTFFRW